MSVIERCPCDPLIAPHYGHRHDCPVRIARIEAERVAGMSEVELLREQLRGAVARAEKAEAQLAKAESVLVAADRVREAYDAMLDGRKLGPLPDFGGR